MCNLLGRAGQFIADFREVWDILHTPPPAEPEMYTSTCGTCGSTWLHCEGLTDNPIPCCPLRWADPGDDDIAGSAGSPENILNNLMRHGGGE